MILNSNNIEKWFFDYFEGELTVLERKEVEQFVLTNPEYQTDFKAWKDAYNSSNETVIPAYVAPASLFVKVAFYETAAFRIAASLILLLSFGTITSWFLLSNTTATNTVSSYQITNYNPTLFSRFTYSYLSEGDQSMAIQGIQNNGTSTKFTVSVPQTEFPISTVHQHNLNEIATATPVLNLITNQTNQTNNQLVKYSVRKETQLISKRLLANTVIKSADNSVNSIPNTKNYKFLDFRNNSVKGVENTIKDNRTKSTNVAEISDGYTGKSNNNRKKTILEKLKTIDLGLMNINDPIFEITNYQPLVLNPSLIGQLGFTRLKSYYRNQSSQMSNPIQQMGVSFDSYINRLKAGVLFNAQTLVFNTASKASTFSIAYSQKFELSKEQSVAATLEYSVFSLSTNQPFTQNFELNAGFMANANRLNELASKDLWHNLGVSSFFNGKYFYGGLNVTNLLGNHYTSTEEKSFLSDLNYSIQLGTDYKKSFYSNFVIAPYIVFNKFGDRKELWMGSSLRFKGFISGLTVSSQMAAKAFIGVQTSKYRIVYGYDINKKNIDFNNYIGNHELSFRILLGSKYNNWSR